MNVCVLYLNIKTRTQSVIVKKSALKKPVVDEVVDLDALTKDTSSPNYILFPLVEASRNENSLTPFKTTHSGLMGVAVKEMPTNEVSLLYL